MKVFTPAAAQRLEFLTALSFLILAGLSGRILLFGFVLTGLIAFSIVRRIRPQKIPHVWASFALGCLWLTFVPVDIKFEDSFPRGVWVRPAVWGLLMGPVPRDDHGVPRFWWAGTCIVPHSPPPYVVVVGLGESTEVMAEQYRWQEEDWETQLRIDEVRYAYEMHFIQHSTYPDVDLDELRAEYLISYDDCVSLETEVSEGFYAIRGTHCESPHVFEITNERGHLEDGRAWRID